MATGTESYLNNPGFADLKKESEKWFVQESVNPGTLGSEVVQGEFAIDDGLVAFDTPPVFTDYSQPNNPVVPEVETATTVKTIRGANYDVINSKVRALSNITFIPGTACAMSEAIAYIRYWSRKGTQQKTPVNQEEQNDIPQDPQEQLGQKLSDKYYKSAKAFDDVSIEEQYVQSGDAIGGDFTEESNNTPQASRTVLTVPKNTAYQSRPRQPVPTRTEVPASTTSPKAGTVHSANPSGSVATAPSALPAEAVWTFLFNPEELQLSSGPDYNRAETCGVSDPTNSGQPLSWRSNKNRKLTFSKVLLHGYSFGKRVDSLERGLQELFTARDGENGSDGPPVLEFVWGKRVFGPCVIQNIQVREKALDKGLLVNAEVSFELEQVPEWTINDGFVDVLRPGRQPTVNDELLPASTREAEADPGDVEDKKNDDKKTPDGGKPPVPGDPDKCLRVQKEVSVWQQVDKRSGTELRSIFTGKDSYDKISASYRSAYTNNLKELDLRPYLSKTNPGCLTSVAGFVYVPDYRRAVAYINTCSRRIVDAYNKWLIDQGGSGGQCVALKSARLAKEKAQEQARKAQEEAKKCEQYDNGKPCTSFQLGSQITCLGLVRQCVRPDGNPLHRCEWKVVGS